MVILDLMSDDHVTGNAAIFWRKNMKNHNLLLAKWKILNIIIIFQVFGIAKFIGDVKFAVRQPRDRIRRHLLAGKYENTIIYL